jgi:hypothetical protein
MNISDESLIDFEYLGPSRLDKLVTLYLNDNNFNNSILSSLKELSSLKYLHLGGNQLQGSINMKDT